MRDLPELIILDVGHGNCAILRDTEAVTIIDCPPTTTLLDTLTQLNIDTIDQVLISHADFDHTSGLLALLRERVVRKIYINPDATKKSKAWREIRVALALAEITGTEIHLELTSTLSRRIRSGQIEIEILSPSLGMALSGAGGNDINGRSLTSNSMSAVIGLVHNSQRVALLAGDLDEVGLDNLLKQQKDIRARILIFPHHGGKPGNGNGFTFAQNLCQHVTPDMILFSYGRERFEYPQENIVKGVVTVVPDAHIMCTQLSRKCSIEPLQSDFYHLTSLPSASFGSTNSCCCGGSISVKMSNEQITYAPQLNLHRKFIGENVPTPLCLKYLSGRYKDRS
jgi:beta-lactamase superfamily II metal-dependent hydrolase